MASSLQTMTATMILVSLLLGCVEQVSGMRYIPNSPNTNEVKHSDFLVNIVPQPSGIIPRLGRFLLPPKPDNTPFHSYKAPFAAAPSTYCETPSHLAPNPGYEAPSPNSGEDSVPPVPQP